jgi:diguanylate cyclase (GGDEF)-like protein
MHRLLLIPLAGSTLPSWELRGFRIARAVDEADGLQWLTSQRFDLVVIVARRGAHLVPGLCARLEEAGGIDPVPRVLAAGPAEVALPDAFTGHTFDGFVDLAWPTGLIEQCLSLAVARVRSGRGVAAFQHQVLSELRQELATLRDLSIRDELTGLYNVRHFREVLAHEHQRCARHERSYGVVLFDLDNLRQLNNGWGHDVGTRALIRLAEVLDTCTRKSDYAFRVGGDEFVSLLIESDRDSARHFAERICAAVRQCDLLESGVRIPLATSAGVAAFPVDGRTSEEIVHNADVALYRAKALGRNQTVCCSKEPRGERSA